jgi:nucleoside-diphosphate-sugar epimerase
MRQKVLLIGGCGFIGRHLHRKLKDCGFEVVIADRKNAGIDAEEFIQIDILKEIDLEDSYELVVHLAGISHDIDNDPLIYEKANTLGTINVLNWIKSKKVRRFIFLSSASIYGSNYNQSVTENIEPAPKSPYAVSKLNAENWIRYYLREHSIDGYIFRLFNVYGTGMSSRTSFMEIIAQISGKAQEIILKNKYDVIDCINVEDVSEGIIRGLQSESPGMHIINLCTMKGTSLGELTTELMEISGIQKKVRSLKSNCETYRVGDNSRLKELFNWQPEIDLEAGLRKLWQEARGK